VAKLPLNPVSITERRPELLEDLHGQYLVGVERMCLPVPARARKDTFPVSAEKESR
jgi:hypothetical protein